eukprot:5238780-Pyramimonas_sp.AAC.1
MKRSHLHDVCVSRNHGHTRTDEVGTLGPPGMPQNTFRGDQDHEQLFYHELPSPTLSELSEGGEQPVADTFGEHCTRFVPKATT